MENNEPKTMKLDGIYSEALVNATFTDEPTLIAAEETSADGWKTPSSLLSVCIFQQHK